jgi:hypothetical protein
VVAVQDLELTLSAARPVRFYRGEKIGMQLPLFSAEGRKANCPYEKSFKVVITHDLRYTVFL